MDSRQRFAALDSLRFIAAAVVVGSHAQSMMSWHGAWASWASGLADARAAVVFFFVLSGFVLHLSYRGSWPDAQSYKGFIVRRWFRVVPLYYISLLLALVIIETVPMAGCPCFHDEGSGAMVLTSDHTNLRQWIGHLLLIDPGIDPQFLNPPIWTLAAEMQVAFIFPWLSWLVGRCDLMKSILLLTLLMAVMPFLGEVTGKPNVALIPLFAIGAVLAVHYEKLLFLLGKRGCLAGFIVGLCLYSLPAFPGGFGMFRDSIISIGASLVILGVLGLASLRAMLEFRPLVACGAASYGLYVLHFPIMMGMAWVAWRIGMPPLMLLLSAGSISLMLAFAMRSLVELPLIDEGRRIIGLRPKG